MKAKYQYSTFDAVLEALADERHVCRDAIAPAVLRRRVWLMQFYAAGCLADHSEVCRTKGDALACARLLYAEDAPRGFMGKLRAFGLAPADTAGYYRVSVRQCAVADLC
ncbi:MAG: hypothetical protein KAY22_05570 [Rhizorhabdus sp.]|uniref:hypothetical protein n=1 Tax=Rhizorhabdus sp. TaxID=1968843 RepID=UPI001B582D67|nr:hypothetical protein [Rhizorhabdus sp.]MBP8231754.1 hypothetical protein [Rhizorhabdus sp.]